MDRYDTFWLSQAPQVRLPDGEPCFPGVPGHTPQQILAAHGLRAGEARILDAGQWRDRHAVAASRQLTFAKAGYSRNASKQKRLVAHRRAPRSAIPGHIPRS